MKKTVSNLSFIWTIAASMYVIYDNHFYDGASGVSVWAFIAILIIGLFAVKRLGAWATEWGMVDNGKGMLVKTFRRPFFAGIYIFGALIAVLGVTQWLMIYIETNTQNLSATLNLMIYIAIAGYGINFSSLFIPQPKKATE